MNTNDFCFICGEPNDSTSVFMDVRAEYGSFAKGYAHPECVNFNNLETNTMDTNDLPEGITINSKGWDMDDFGDPRMNISRAIHSHMVELPGKDEIVEAINDPSNWTINNPKENTDMTITLCEATTKAGEPCKNKPKKGSIFCGPHMPRPTVDPHTGERNNDAELEQAKVQNIDTMVEDAREEALDHHQETVEFVSNVIKAFNDTFTDDALRMDMKKVFVAIFGPKEEWTLDRRTEMLEVFNTVKKYRFSFQRYVNAANMAQASSLVIKINGTQTRIIDWVNAF